MAQRQAARAGPGVSATIYGKIKKTVKHTLIFGIGSVINSAFGFLLVPVYVRLLPVGEYGVLSLLTITLTLVTIVLKFGLNHAFFRHYYETEDPAHRRRIVGSTLVFLLVSASAFTALLLLLAPQLSALLFKDNASTAHLLRLVLLISFFEVLTLIPDSILRANFRSARYSTLNIVAFAFQVILVSYLVIVVNASVESVLVGRLAGAAFEAAIFFLVVRRDLSLNFSLAELRGMLAFGFPLIFGQISFTLFMMIDRFFLERMTSDREVGVYAIANQLIMVVSVLVTVPFSQVWTVMRFSVMKEEGAEEYYSRVLTYILFISMFLALGVAAVAGDGLLVFAVKGYWPAATIIPLLALSAVLDSASRVLNIGITLRKRTVYAPLVVGVALAVNVGLNFILIPAYQSLGATVSTLISYVVLCALRYWASNLFFKVRYEWGRVFMLLATGCVLIVSFYAIDSLRGETSRRAGFFLSTFIKIALALAFPLLLLALGFYDERERRRLREIWQKVGIMLRRRRVKEASMMALALIGATAVLTRLILSAASG